MSLGLKYFKRFRMEIPLAGVEITTPILEAFRLIPWDLSLLEIHARTKYLSFRGEIDADVFPCLGDYHGCLRLMEDISRKPGFLPEATWLIGREEPQGYVYCGTIQGIRDKQGYGAVQNLGIRGEFRGLGLGTCLLLQALRGFQYQGLHSAYLEVTAKNRHAVRLYQRLGFEKVKTLYKVAEPVAEMALPM